VSKKILQINSRFHISPAGLEEEFKGAADPISKVPGLEWKIFGANADRSEAAGIYLFEDAESLQAYLEGPIMAAMQTKPVFGDIEVKIFDVAEEATRTTRGPV